MEARPDVKRRIKRLIVDVEDAANPSPIAKAAFNSIATLPRLERLSIIDFKAKIDQQ